MSVFLAGFVPFESRIKIYEALADYLGGHGYAVLRDTTGDGVPELVCLVRATDYEESYPIEYTTLVVEWQVRTGDRTGQPATVPDRIRLQWLDRIDDRFREFDRYEDVQQSVPGPDGFTPTFGYHQDDTHPELGPAHLQLERAGDREAERASVPYDPVGEPPVAIVAYFLDEAAAQLSRVHSTGQH